MASSALQRLESGTALPAPERHCEMQRVVIAGAGPAGLSLALGLARLGVPVTVLEKGAELAEESRASTLHPPTLELLADLGVIEPVLAAGLRAPKTQFRDRLKGPVATFDLGVLADDTPYPYRVQLEQNKLAEMLAVELLAGTVDGRWDAEILMQHRSHGVISADDTGVTLLVGTEDGFESIRCPWLIGADGAHSAVRDSLGIAMLGETYPERYLVVSVQDELSDFLADLALVNYVADPDEWLVLLRTPDHWRVLFPIGVDDVATALDPHRIQAKLNEVINADHTWSVLAASLYIVSRAVATTMRLGRVLLAGDAAHQNSPLGGMGMNSGIQDAVSCARRLASVWHGTASEAVLDEYDVLRREVATGYVQTDSHANWLVLREPDHAKRAALQAELREIAADPLRHRERMLRTAMLDAVRNNL